MTRGAPLRGSGVGLLVAALLATLPAPAAEPPAASAEATPAPAPAPAATPAPDAAAPGVRRVFGTIMGTIFDTKRMPLPGWMVQLSSRGDDGLLRVTGTDERGQYVFKDLPAGLYDIEVHTDTEARKKGHIEVRPPFRNIVDFEIGPAAPTAPNPLANLKPPPKGGPAGAADEPRVAVRGRFLDAAKSPVSEVSVTLVSLDGTAASWQAFSADDGSFLIPAVPAGPYRVLVFSPGYVPIDLKSIEVSAASGLNLSLVLVDYPLNVKERPEERLPREEPLPVPGASPAPVASPAASPAQASPAPSPGASPAASPGASPAASPVPSPAPTSAPS